LRAVPRPEVEGLRWTSAEQWHVTLRFFGEADPAVAKRALSGFTAATTVAKVGPETGRFGRRILHVPVAGLAEVARLVTDRTDGVGEPPDRRHFRGHITLARATGAGRGIDLRELTGTPVEAAWTVDRIALMASHPNPKGARYEVLENFVLS
jgi:RNA 2',3'-cyclic 3'-phosphodiesterase